MRSRWHLILAAAAITAAVPISAAADFAAEIRAASTKLLSTSAAPEDARAGVAALVDVLGRMAKADGELADSARTPILRAADAFRTNTSFEGSGVEALHGAWRAMNGGKAFVFSEEVKDISGARTAAQASIDRCLSALSRNNRGAAVRDLLEFLLIVLTPMEVR
jgi:hypothetical protein